MSRHAMPIDSPETHAEYVLYQLAFSGDVDRFTAREMSGWLGEHGVEMSPSEVRRELSSYVEAGMLHSYLTHYVVPKSRRDHREWWSDGPCPA